MFKAVSNPPSSFDACVEWDVPPPAAKVRVYEDHARSLLSRNNSPDLGFTWSANVYRGCLHACAYCYARASHEYLGFGAGTDFETQLVVKPEAPSLLRTAFEKPSWRGERIVFSGNSDCYQPLEVHYRLTRGCLQVCERYRNPVSIITRSTIIERDIDLLVRLHARATVVVTISIPFHDAAIARLIEPHAPAPMRRYRIIRTLADAGIPVGVNIAPLIPGLNDRSVPDILTHARDAGASWSGLMLVRLTDKVAQVFEERLRTHLPDRADAVLNRIARTRGGSGFGERMSGRGASWRAVHDLYRLWKRRLGYGSMPACPHPSPFVRPGQGQESLF